jgi:hypothetical protein
MALFRTILGADSGRPHGRLHVALARAIVALAVADLYLLAALVRGG